MLLFCCVKDFYEQFLHSPIEKEGDAFVELKQCNESTRVTDFYFLP